MSHGRALEALGVGLSGKVPEHLGIWAGYVPDS